MKKFKYRRSYFRVFSVFIALVMIVLSVPFSATAQESTENETDIAASIGVTYGQDHTDAPAQKSPEVLAADAEAMRREQLIQNGIDPDQPLQSNSTAQLVQGGEELEPIASYAKVFDDGVYAIQSVANSGYFLNNEHPEWAAGYHMQQKFFASATIIFNNFSASAMFKIKRDDDTGSYIIRPMYNNALSFDIVSKADGSGFEILTKNIEVDDELVPLSDTYVISASGSGFRIRKYGTTNCIAVNGNETNLTATWEIGNSMRWTFTQYTGAERNSAVILCSATPTVAQTLTFLPVTSSTRPGYNAMYLDMSGIPSSSYSLSAYDSYGRFTVTPHDGPDWTIGIYIENASLTSSPLLYANDQDFKITLPIEEGIYFFRNKEVGKYIQIDDNDEPNYSTNGSHMELFGFDGGDYQKWQLDHISDGYYKILSVKSGMALCVPSGSINEDEVALVQESYSNLSRKKWKITKSSSGAYVLRPKSGDSYDTDWCMCAGDQFLGITDGLNVEQKAYVNNSNYKDEWELFKIEYDSLVPGEGQQKSNWCWVTSARMFSKHLYPSITYTQSNAVTYVKGSDVNEGGNRAEAQQAINYYISNISGASIDTVIKEYVIYSEENLVRFLDNGYVIYIARGWYKDTNDPTTRDGGHATLIYGYTTVDSEIWFLVRDPWPINKGKSYIISYDKLCNGANCKPGEESDTGVWYASIVVNTSYANETIPYYFDK